MTKPPNKYHKKYKVQKDTNRTSPMKSSQDFIARTLDQKGEANENLIAKEITRLIALIESYNQKKINSKGTKSKVKFKTSRKSKEELAFQRKKEIMGIVEKYDLEKEKIKKDKLKKIFYAFLFFISTTYLHAVEITHNVLPDLHSFSIVIGALLSLIYYYLGIKAGHQ